MMVNGVSSSGDSSPVISNSSSSESSLTSIKPISRQRSTHCNLIKEELREEDEDEFHENGLGLGEVKQCHSANELSSNDNASCVRGKSSPSTVPRVLQTVHSMPQLMLNQISEEDEEEETSSSFAAYPQHQPMFSIASAGEFGGCARKANRKSSMKNLMTVQSGMASASSVSRSSGDKHEKGLHSTATKESSTNVVSSVPVEADGRRWTAAVGQRRIHCSSSDDEDDSSILVGHFCLRHEPVRQHSLVQSCNDMEGLDSDRTTNSLDRRLFQHSRKDGKSAAGRSIVGAVKKSVSALLGHLSAVGDVTSAKPRCIETWSSCSDLVQAASSKLRCADNISTNLADRQRVARCQFARELRQNRSEREAQFNDTNKSQSSSSHVIRVRSRDFDTLISKFTTADQTTITSLKTDTS